MRTKRRHRVHQTGFTLIEIMVVMTIIGLLMALIGPRFMRAVGRAESGAARAQIEMLGTALDTYRLDVGRYPTTQEGLQALIQRPFGSDHWDGPYLKKNLIPEDPWHRAYFYKSPGDAGRSYDLYSLGADGSPGGEGDSRDVTSWGEDVG
jgi:general secretion pathway protein G